MMVEPRRKEYRLAAELLERVLPFLSQTVKESVSGCPPSVRLARQRREVLLEDLAGRIAMYRYELERRDR